MKKIQKSNAGAWLRTLVPACLMGFLPVTAWGQDDPTVMTINGQPVSRSEFEYSYNKNNAEGVVDKKSVDEYVDLFINYKLKVLAAEEAGLDTLSSFKDEFAGYRDQQVRPSFITDEDVERKARSIYQETQQRVDSAGGLVKVAHILVMVRQNAPAEQQAAAKQRVDSLYNALEKGAAFADLARQYSDDKGTAVRGGELGWIQKGSTVKEFEDMAFSLKKGETGKPVLSPYGYHIVNVMDKSLFFPYDSLRADIYRFIEARGLREQIIDQKLDSIAKASVPATTPAALLEQRAAELSVDDSDLRNLIREYHDGLLLFEISSKTVWDKGANDVEGLTAYFKKNKKKYAWEEPRFKGMAYYVKDKDNVKVLKAAVKGLPVSQWEKELKKAFQNDSIFPVHGKTGLFKKGDSPLVDRNIFKLDVEVKENPDFPVTGTYGKLLKAPQDYTDVKSQVVADYQEELEKAWVADLRKRYDVQVDETVLATVNQHE